MLGELEFTRFDFGPAHPFLVPEFIPFRCPCEPWYPAPVPPVWFDLYKKFSDYKFTPYKINPLRVFTPAYIKQL